MSYMDAWHLIAPAIADTLLMTKEGTEAYVMLFAALKQAEEASDKTSEKDER